METHENSNNSIVQTSGKAIASLILSLVWLSGFGSLLAIIFGHIARSEIKKSDGRLTGNGLALAGLIIGYIGFILVFVVLLAVALPKLAN